MNELTEIQFDQVAILYFLDIFVKLLSRSKGRFFNTFSRRSFQMIRVCECMV